MAEVVTINEKEYIFDLNRENYRKYVLQDYEYATIQTKLASLTTAKAEESKNKGEEIDNIKSKIENLNKADLEAYYNSDICVEIFKRIKELDTHNLKSSEL